MNANVDTNLVPANNTLPAVPVDGTADLTSTQIAVLDGLLSGKTATAAAAAAGIARRTLYKWLRQDYGFQAALNRGRREYQQAVACRIELIAADAAECVGGAVRNGDVKTALEILKRTGALAPANIGSDDELILQVEQQEKNELRDMRLSLAGPGDEKMLSTMKLLSDMKLLSRRNKSKGLAKTTQ